MARGGARAGSGRKPGTANAKTRAIADKAAAEGITPLEVLLSLMGDSYKKYLDEKSPLQKMEFAATAAQLAKDAAPYIHPRLAAVEHSGGLELGELNDADLDKRIAQLAAQAGINAASGGEGAAEEAE